MKTRKVGGAVAIGLAGLMLAVRVLDGKRAMIDEKTPVTDPEGIRNRIIAIARHEVGTQEALKYGPSEDNWCGNFTLWVLHQAGLAKGVSPHWRWCVDLPVTDDPLPGDIVFFGPPNNHEAILVSLTDDTVTTIDGNQEAEHGPGKGLVWMRVRQRSKVDSFRSIQGLINESHSPIA